MEDEAVYYAESYRSIRAAQSLEIRQLARCVPGYCRLQTACRGRYTRRKHQ